MQFGSATVAPAVALVSAPKITPSYSKKNEGLKVKYGWTYLEDETANGCTGLGIFHITSSLNIVFLQSLVSDAVVVVEATSLQIIHVFKIHFKYFFG